MNTKNLTTYLSVIQERFQAQFTAPLTPALLSECLDEEIKRRKFEFLRSELVNLDLSFHSLLDLSKLISNKITPTPKLEEEVTSENSDSTPQKRRGRRRVLSDVERAERRRSYARDYYQRRREKEKTARGEDPTRQKMYKTSPEQRAYQRAYYQRNSSKKTDMKAQQPLIPAEQITVAPPITTRLRKSSNNRTNHS